MVVWRGIVQSNCHRKEQPSVELHLWGGWSKVSWSRCFRVGPGADGRGRWCFWSISLSITNYLSLRLRPSSYCPSTPQRTRYHWKPQTHGTESTLSLIVPMRSIQTKTSHVLVVTGVYVMTYLNLSIFTMVITLQAGLLYYTNVMTVVDKTSYPVLTPSGQSVYCISWTRSRNLAVCWQVTRGCSETPTLMSHWRSMAKSCFCQSLWTVDAKHQ